MTPNASGIQTVPSRAMITSTSAGSLSSIGTAIDTGGQASDSGRPAFAPSAAKSFISSIPPALQATQTRKGEEEENTDTYADTQRSASPPLQTTAPHQLHKDD